MSNGNLKKEKRKMKFVKYFIFSFALLATFFAMFTGKTVSAADATVTTTFELFESNHKGDGNSYDAVSVCKTGEGTCDKNISETVYNSGWYVQTTGVGKKDTVSFKVVITTTGEINGVTVFESNFSSSAGANASYDAYAKHDTTWSNVVGATGLEKGNVVSTLPAGGLDASDASLFANDNTKDYYSLMHITESVDGSTTTITINYVYTIRSNDYGEKIITFAIYNTSPYNFETGAWNPPMVAHDFDVRFVASKPADEFKIQWLDSATEVAGTTGTEDVNETNNITIEYVNGTKGKESKTISFTIPQEMAYWHDVSGNTEATIANNSIYTINTLDATNAGASGVQYYYHKFAWKTGEDNIEMNPSKNYYLILVIDASGSYALYIKDVFGNTISSGDTGSESATVTDISKNELIVDFTNAQNLTILEASAAYTDSSWKNEWVFTFAASEKIDFTKMVQSEIIIEIHVFYKVQIGSDAIHISSTPNIAKQVLKHVDSYSAGADVEFKNSDVKIWRVKDIEDDEAQDDNVSCGTGASESSCYTGLTYSTSTSAYGGAKNKITFTITNNGRYRIEISDKFTNTTNELTPDKKNPKVEVTIIDKTTPIITSGLTGASTSAASTSIETYAYVNGGGEGNKADKVYVPGEASTLSDDYYSTASYAGIYYEAGGNKVFDYKDALEIAKIKIVDNVWYYDETDFDNIYSGYSVYMNAHDSTATDHGKYMDSGSSYLSDRNTDSETTEIETDVNIHEYIINKNITSFTGGLVKEVGYTAYAKDDYTKITGNESYATPLVNKKDAESFLGYFKIAFKEKVNSNVVCELTISTTDDAANTSNADNLSCLKKINKMIDDVENFDMVFSATDYLNNESNVYTVSVTVIDTTNPAVSGSTLNYTNTSTSCRLEMGNLIQTKADLLECYKLTATGTYNFKDNNVHSVDNWDTDTSDSDYVYNYSEVGNQFYAKNASGTELTATSDDHYFNKIKLFVYGTQDKPASSADCDYGYSDDCWEEVTIDNIPALDKSGDHMLRIEIRDHWDSLSSDASHADNLLTFYVNYYVNPRTLLIEPLATEKMYGEDDPFIDYCVYVNTTTGTFDLESSFFDVEFINAYFTNIYCTRDVFAKVEAANRYTRADGAATKPYAYYTYTQADGGAYLKVNNTYVLIPSSSSLYYGGYKQSDAGNYLWVDDGDTNKEPAEFYEIKSGYLYNDSTCKYAYMGESGESMYLNIGTSCEPVTNANRHEFVYRNANTDTNVVYDGQGQVYLKYNSNNTNDSNADAIPDVNQALVKTAVLDNKFQGALTRVESSCYNSFVSSSKEYTISGTDVKDSGGATVGSYDTATSKVTITSTGKVYTISGTSVVDSNNQIVGAYNTTNQKINLYGSYEDYLTNCANATEYTISGATVKNSAGTTVGSYDSTNKKVTITSTGKVYTISGRYIFDSKNQKAGSYDSATQKLYYLYDYSYDAINKRNDNVGQYHIALGTLSIEKYNNVDYNSDYVIKLNTNYWATETNFQETQGRYNFASGKLIDDMVVAESTVNFTIRQAVLTITTNGSGKNYGEQDPYTNNWNNTNTNINNATTGYLGGYDVHGWRNDDNDSGGNDTLTTSAQIIEGTLRREFGEEVGTYVICNINSNPRDVDSTECKRDHETPALYDSTNPYYFAEFDYYNADGTSNATGETTSRASLHIRTNVDIYGNATGRTLNTGTRNYAISFVNLNKLTINPVDLIIQPGINQGKEYAATQYHDPLWQLVLYGEAMINDGTETGGAFSSNTAEEQKALFNGYTATIAVDSNEKEPQLRVGPYYCVAGQNDAASGCDNRGGVYSAETEVYFARRKSSPNEIYKYSMPVTFAATDRYAKETIDGVDVYHKSTTGKYIYKYGKYYEVTDGATSATLEIIGNLVNETYTLFGSGFVLERNNTSGAVGWYTYKTVENFNASNVFTIKSVAARNSNECKITATTVEVNTSSATHPCTNYNVVYKNTAPVRSDETDNATPETYIFTTTHTDTNTVVYKPNGVNECTDGSVYSTACEATDSKQILFEIFKREIIIEFIDENYTFIYGNRYDYYDGGTATSSGYTYNNNTDGVFYINNSTSERDIFLCYSDLGDYLVDCTGNADYGVTAGDTWSGIGLKFYLHSAISAYNSGYYKTETDPDDQVDQAVPAGTYYVYAEISSAALQNYKFTYRGGTITIKPKTTSIQLTGYTMEYGESSYYSYGTGNDYSDYAIYSGCTMSDAYYTETDATELAKLIEATGCSELNIVGNTYGFTVEGLDIKDTIKDNFKGRPARTTGNNVGYYKINVGTIDTINGVFHKEIFTIDGTAVKNSAGATIGAYDSTTKVLTVTGIHGTYYKIAANGTDVEDVNGNVVGTFASNTVTLLDNTAVNYDIAYSVGQTSSKEHNEGAYLFITPAKIDITVYSGQTKMYGCAYYRYVADNGDLKPYSYYDGYTYASGYTTTNCNPGTDAELDMAYKYKVTGDKDAGAEYDVTTDADGKQTVTGATLANISLTDTRLYRVTKTSDPYEYGTIRAYDKKHEGQIAKYQGQSVGVYTITLGNLDVKTNGNNMCDAYNNPVLEGGTICQNYNINYYGNSSTTDITSHKYTDTIEVDVNTLAKYVLNYTEDSNGEYIFVNGKYVRIADLINDGSGNVLVNNYVTKTSLNKYKKLADYIANPSCTTCYVYVDLDGSGAQYHLITSDEVKAKRYSTYGDLTTRADDGQYILINGNFIQLSTLTKFEQSSADYVQDNTNGKYVLINGEYVQLSSLKTYTYNSTTELYSEGNGDYVLIYEYKDLGTLTRYTLSADSAEMYKHNQSASTTDNVYVFIDGSYVPYNSLTITSGKVTVNMARTWDTTNSAFVETRKVDGSGALVATTDTDFTITARIVYVHPEYNVKPYQEDDPLEYITCKEIQSAYYNANNKADGRSSYCANYDEYDPNDNTKNGAHIDMGVAMYYAVQNSLAKSPWTAWTDSDEVTVTGTGATQTIAHTYAKYDDIQYDVLTGKLSRLMTTTEGKNDVAGKYTYDFKDVTNVGTINGANYMIVHVTNYDVKDTYIDVSSTKTALNTLIYDYVGDGETTNDCKRGDAYCAYINHSTTATPDYKLTKVKNNSFTYDGTSISLLEKYYKVSEGSYNEIDFWYLGFYKEDETPGRTEELAKWWKSRSVFSTPYDTFKNSNDSDNKITDNDFSEKKQVYFEIVRRTIYLYAVDAEKTYGEADNYNDFLVAICGNEYGYTIDGNGIKCKDTENIRYGYGLGAEDLATFVNPSNGTMNQNLIKNGGAEGEYIFQGATDAEGSFGIYFRRANGENAGVYTITACAMQSDIVDCTNKNEKELEHTSINYLGDNYKIIEIPGVLTINPREIVINPHSGQGFEYGNYTENGTMPNITFSEASVLGTIDTSNHKVTVNSVNYTIDGTSIKKRSLTVGTIDTANNKLTINGVIYTISGTDVLSSGGLVFGNGAYLYSGTTQVAEITVTNSSNIQVNEFVIGTKTYYIDGLDVINKTDKTWAGRVNITGTGVNIKTITVDGTTYDLVQKAKCLINVSGLYTVCINDAQNEKLGGTIEDWFDSDGNINAKYAVYGANYTATALGTEIRVGTNTSSETTKVVKKARKEYYNYNVYADNYSDPSRLHSRSETETRNALNLVCGSATSVDVRYSRDVCNYDIVIENADGTTKYLTVSNTVKVTTSFFIHLSNSRRYKLDGSNYVQDDEGGYVKYGNQYVAIPATKYREAAPTDYNADGSVKEGIDIVDGGYVLDNTNGTYVKISVTLYNYNIVGFDDTQKFNVTPAELKVTPDEKQYKVYGEADPEIKFTVQTEYEVANTHYQEYSDKIIKLCNGSTCYDTVTAISDYRYDTKGGTQDDDGDYILLIKGWIVTLSTYAYSETSGNTDNLDYGKNFTATKYGATGSALGQDVSDVTHYDKYTTYKTTSVSTDRILLGNLYVTDHDQSIGVKFIANGLKIAQNNLAKYQASGATNYTLNYSADTYKFTIIPRPVNVQIENITKTYGQATDSVSCAPGYDTECIVGEGILTATDNNSLLVNNFNVVDKGVSSQTITIDGVGDITVVYYDDDIDAINMPDDKSKALVSGDTYYAYADAVADNYYTETYDASDTDKETGLVETKNATLNIKVVRENINIARGSDECLVTVTGETYCEDVGEYFLSFAVRTAYTTEEQEAQEKDEVINAYYSSYWGYNPNYYVIVYNNFEASEWDGEYTNSITAKTDVYYAMQGKETTIDTETTYVGTFSTSTVINESTLAYGNTYTANSVPGPTATLKIRKRAVQMVIETISEYDYTLKADGSGEYIKIDSEYYLIMDTNRYKLENSKFVQLERGTAQTIGQYVCTYATNNVNSADNCHAISATNTYDRESKEVGERYNIEQNMYIPEPPAISNRGTDNSGKHHTTYDETDHLGYITWYEQPRQVRVGDELFGNAAYCTTTMQLDSNGLDGIRKNAFDSCSGSNLKYFKKGNTTYNPNSEGDPMFFDTRYDGYYLITRDKNELYIRNGTGITNSTYEDNNYDVTFVNGVLQIDKDETPPVINIGAEFIIKEANGGTMVLNGDGEELAFLEKSELRTNECTTTRDASSGNAIVIECDGVVFTYEDSQHQSVAPTISLNDLYTILDWFDVHSYDPSVMRAGSPSAKRYHARWYITIQKDFDQKKTGDYTLFIHAQDDAGNISFASTATLRVVDTTAPVVGTLNLYDTKVKCKTGTDCNVESNWVVDASSETDGAFYLPVHTFTSDRLTAFQADALYDSNKYALSSTGTYSANNVFGTYYKVKDGVTAAVVKHTGWTNSSSGIYMTVIGGDDNSLAYLDTSKYSTRYTISGDNFSQGSGTNILLGSLINVDSLTKYRAVLLDSNGDEVTSGGTKTVYIPDISGTYIKYKGYYFDLVNGTYVGSPADEYKVKLYKKDGDNYTKKTKVDSGDYQASNVDGDNFKVFATGYYILDGDMYEIPETKYSVEGSGYKHNNSGTYVNFAQWDSYYSRDGGNSWAKYSRDTLSGYLALGQDGQRLIMIKAVDTGYTYKEIADASKTQKEFVEDSYCLTTQDKMTCFTWNNVDTGGGHSVSTSAAGTNVGTISGSQLTINGVAYTIVGATIRTAVGTIDASANKLQIDGITYVIDETDDTTINDGSGTSVGAINIAGGTLTVNGVSYTITGTTINKNVGTYDSANNKVVINSTTYNISGSNILSSGKELNVTANTSGKYTEYEMTKDSASLYNVSLWAEYNQAETKDIKFAYLDTIMPIVSIEYTEAIAVYEYDCGDDPTRCTTNHNELFGKATDGYVYPLDKLVKYKKNADNSYTALGYSSTEGTYVLVFGQYIEITASRKLSKNEGKTLACIDSAAGGNCMYYVNSSGTYIYLRGTDSAATIDEYVTGRIIAHITKDGSPLKKNDAASGQLQVYDDNISDEYVITLPTTAATSETSANLQANTWYKASGVGQGASNTFDGIEGVDKQFGDGTDDDGDAITKEISDDFVTISIYADVRGGDAISSGHPYFAGLGSYKFMIKKVSSNYEVHKCYKSTGTFTESEWCGTTTAVKTFTKMQDAMNSILAVYVDGDDSGSENDLNFGDNKITFTIDYRVMDLAGNTSFYVRKGILFSTFVPRIGIYNPQTAQLSNVMAVEVEQNEDLTQLLSNFMVTTTTGDPLDSLERIVQTVYYNGMVVSENGTYDLSMLRNIDTSTPGEYKVVYTAQRKDGTVYVDGNSVELTITIKPNIANIGESKIDYIMITLVVVTMISLATVMYISLRKKKNI